jgi:DNA-directed RNA polymerase subunit beta'
MQVEAFEAIRVGLATSEDIKSWSSGEVKKPETINYRTLKPEKDGLFCERIFGPTKDWECSCGKYKRARYKDVVCERCGVQVTKSSVRRERMGHITLAAPVTHIWYYKGVPSRLGYLLDLAPKDLDKIIYFAAYRVMSVNQEEKDYNADFDREDYVARMSEMLEAREAEMYEVAADEIAALEAEGLKMQAAPKFWELPEWVPQDIAKSVDQLVAAEMRDPEGFWNQKPLEPASKVVKDLLAAFKKKTDKIVREYGRRERRESLQREQFAWRLYLTAKEGTLVQYDDIFDAFHYNYGDYFNVAIGAEAIQQMLVAFEGEKVAAELRERIATSKGTKQTYAIKRLKVVNSFIQSGTAPAAMVLDVLPVLPPEIRPMVQLDGGRFATSDLNDLYRRVINRNNRLQKFLELETVPRTIINNEKRMLQEAVDALFDNGRRGRAVTGTGNRALKSLSDLLKGKQGRFRQNLLGKRVDYSGRSVIVVGPQLKLHQCGLPKLMALELFKPFVMKRLEDLGYAQNIKGAKRMVERSRPQVWEVLEEVIRERPVLLNRAPTLHRLGIQAFEPVLVEGKAIQLHPLVCTAFNADFDGDQMAVHVPLSLEAQAEARVLMLASNNILKPSDGRPVAVPTQDMIIGLYHLTTEKEGAVGEGKAFGSIAEAELAYDAKALDLQAKVRIRTRGELRETTFGRALFNDALPVGFRYVEEQVGKKQIGQIVTELVEGFDRTLVAQTLDRIKDAGFHWATRSGVSMSISDANFDSSGNFDKLRATMVTAAEKLHTEAQEKFEQGLSSDLQRRDALGALWLKTTNEIEAELKKAIPTGNAIKTMVESGARGNWLQIRSIIGMRGPVATSSGDFAPMPVKGNYLLGLTASEYFINATGARKGNADTAMKTAAAGYLTRRLVDVAQDVIIRDEDCGTSRGLEKPLKDADGNWAKDQAELTVLHRTLQQDVVAGGKTLAKAGTAVDAKALALFFENNVEWVNVRSALTCESVQGVCAQCYGVSLASGRRVELGEAVGIIAAQSIGEPGTQLTMRTFHTGGAAQEAKKQTILKSIGGKKVRVERLISYDITQGLNGVTDLLEARVGWRQASKVAQMAFWPGRIEIVDRQHVLPKRDGVVREVILKSGTDNVLKQVVVAHDDKDGSKVPATDVAGKAVVAHFGGKVVEITSEKIRVESDFEVDEIKKVPSQHEKPAKQVKAVYEYALEKFVANGKPVKQKVLVKVGDEVEFNQLLADGLYTYEIKEAKQKKVEKQLEVGAVVTASTPLATFDVPREFEVYVRPLSDEEELAAEKLATQYSFSRTTSKTFKKLSPTTPVAVVSNKDDLLVEDGEYVQPGQYLVDGTPIPHEVLVVSGARAAEAEIIRGVQAIYGSQGVPLHDKHLEIIVRQMLGKVTVIDSGDTELLPGEILDRNRFVQVNKQALEDKKKPASARQEVMGMTRASLAAQSWLSAASFQETTRVLTQAALDKRKDELVGLKENVIIGKLIPAGTGLREYRGISVEPTEEAKNEKYPNRIWDAKVSPAEEISLEPADLSFASIEDYSSTEAAE